MKTLEYHGKAMKWEPYNRCDIVTLLNNGFGGLVALEPGDTTRYDLAIVPNRREKTLHVTRIVGGRAEFCVTLAPHEVEFKIKNEAALGKNPWTQEFLVWWLTELLVKMEWLSGDVVAGEA